MRNGKKAKPVLDCVKTGAIPTNTAPLFLELMGIKKEKETETTMTDTRTETQQAKDYLIKSLDKAISNKDIEIVNTFNIGRNAIENFGDLRKFAKDPNAWLKIDIPEKMEDDAKVWYAWDYMHIENPDRIPDHKGFSAAEKRMRKDASDVKDQIVVMGPEKGLEALNEFKAKEYK